MNFAKLTFAGLQGWTYSQARALDWHIKVTKSGEESMNVGAVLNMPVQVKQGALFGPEEIFEFNGLLWLPQWINNVPTNQGVVTVRTDGNNWSKNTWRNVDAIPDQGIYASLIDWPVTPTGKALIAAGLTPSQGSAFNKEVWLIPIDGYDSEGFPDYGTPLFVDGVGESPGISNGNAPYPHPVLVSGGMPVIMMAKHPQVSRTGMIFVNTGSVAVPVFDTWLNTSDIDERLKSLQHIRFDSQNRAYMATRSTSVVAGTGLFRMTYSGANNDQAAILNPANWSAEELGFQVSPAPTTPPAGGNGQTAQYRGKGIAIDETNLVNGEPTIYLSDESGQVIFKVTNNGGSFGDGRDWDFVIVVGQSGVSGSTDGIGTAALLDSPCGLHIRGDELLCCEKFGRRVRKINLLTLETSTYFGQVGVGIHSDQFDF